MKNRITKWIITLTIMALSGGGYWWYDSHKIRFEDRYKQESIEKGTVLQTVSANGTLNPVVLVNVGTQVSGTVIQLKADFNDHVQKGQVMALLDPSLFDAQIAQSNANVANAHASVVLATANEKRSHELFKKEYVSQQDYDQSVQALASAKASLALATAQLKRDQTNKNYSVITSPVSGVVVDRQISVGQTVAASFQTPILFKIAQDLREMQIDANFAEADIGKIRVGQNVNFNVDAFADQTFKGEVSQIRLNAVTTSNVVTYDIVVAVDNPKKILLPGMTAYVTVIEDQHSNVLLIPNAALRFRSTDDKKAKFKAKKDNHISDATKGHIFILKDEQLKKIYISIGITDGKYTEVTEGAIEAGDQVIVSENNSERDTAKSNSPMKMF
ncbi:MAG: efflux RND transporter periplasmic adaptor subunit [Campylobacterales bacterium]|nr:efflux RND transporter periplasmic adaptor subunit [Campylobacterales bacterium]